MFNAVREYARPDWRGAETTRSVWVKEDRATKAIEWRVMDANMVAQSRMFIWYITYILCVDAAPEISQGGINSQSSFVPLRFFGVCVIGCLSFVFCLDGSGSGAMSHLGNSTGSYVEAGMVRTRRTSPEGCNAKDILIIPPNRFISYIFLLVSFS